MSTKIPSLGYAVLGMLHGKPSSGYDLRKIVSSTSMRNYSDSPGAIYPALSRLERQGLIRGRIEESGIRRRQVFSLTAKGLAELKQWITQSVTGEDLERGHQEIVLRFAFSEYVIGAAASLSLLHSLESALKSYLQALAEEHEALNSKVPAGSGRFAFEYGIRATECLAQWARHTITTYEKRTERS